MMIAASSTAQAGPLGLAVIVVLGLALFFLIRSMNVHLRRVPPSFQRSDREQDTTRPAAGRDSQDSSD